MSLSIISVCILACNGSGYIATCAASVLNQTRRDLKLTVMGNGSIAGALESLCAFSLGTRPSIVRNPESLETTC
ncbi:glycosyltransferase family A protein [Solidesulfovibrio sp.]|uniref:glycosyltransferase family 2 protein n=1 Tax=Solidesulfovibrio sp. TaxID=2910990 RepID=UPI00260B49B3|nr:glycosyltransferase family A protein [Solidesulfovibrio sp.]